MIKISNVEVFGWNAAIRGMRNPMNSWDKSDSIVDCTGLYEIGENDLKLMKNLVKAGTDHSKFLRMIHVQFDMEAPLYFWKEFDTYKVGTVRNSCSTMHKIHAKEFDWDDFSTEHLCERSTHALSHVIDVLNIFRGDYLIDKSKDDWWQIIQLLPSSYNQKATIDLNYQVLRTIRNGDRKTHKLDEWRIGFMEFIDSLPYAAELLREGEENA